MAEDRSDLREHYIPEDEYEVLDFDAVPEPDDPDGVADDPEDEDDGYVEGVDRDGADDRTTQ